MIKKLLMTLMVLGLVMILILPFNSLSAQTPGLGSPEDNACNPGGAMEGKCDSEWEWTCGWYLARWEKAGGWNNPRNVFVDWCQSLLPPRPMLENQPSLGILIGCRSAGGGTSVDFGYSYFVAPGEHLFYLTPNCTGASVIGIIRRVYAPPPFDPVDLCQTYFGTGVLSGPIGDNLYRCQD